MVLQLKNNNISICFSKNGKEHEDIFHKRFTRCGGWNILNDYGNVKLRQSLGEQWGQMIRGPETRQSVLGPNCPFRVFNHFPRRYTGTHRRLFPLGLPHQVATAFQFQGTVPQNSPDCPQTRLFQRSHSATRWQITEKETRRAERARLLEPPHRLISSSCGW